MQSKVNTIQPRFLPGLVNPDIPYLPLSYYSEDENCQAGKFVFEGTDPETQALGIKSGATSENIIGIVVRAPFQSPNNVDNSYYNDIYIKGTGITVLKKGNICVEVTNNPNYKDKVFVNPTTKEIQTGSGSAPSNFIETNFRVTKTRDCGKIIEISNIQF